MSNDTFVFPEDVPGWLTLVEGSALANAAAGKRVLEIGSYLGRSTICMAQTAKQVTAVDPFDGRGTAAPCNTLADFTANLNRHGLGERVAWYEGTAETILPLLPSSAFDLIFIDAAHDADAVRYDVWQAKRLLAPGGVVAFHDYRVSPGDHDGRWDPHVTEAVNEILANGGRLLARHGTVAIVRLGDGSAAPKRMAKTVDPLVALAMPRGGSAIRCADAADAFYRATARGVSRIPMRKATSLAIRCFNLCWAEALNARRDYPVTHFAMQHDDVCPEAGWLDVLMDELDATGADLISAVVPIKNAAGCTSTAVDMDGAPWVVRRLTMHEVCDLPVTFRLEDIDWREPESQLLVNTGLWVCRFDAPWVEKVWFQDHARIVQLPDGEWAAEDISEDWDFSRQLHELGLDIRATRKVGLYHERPEFTNREPWGAWTRDEGYFKCLERGAAQLVGV